MVSLNIIEREAPAYEWLEQLKQYASVADNAQDSLLNALLTRACLRVQEMADRSILACTFSLRDSEVEDNTVRLYQTVAQVLNVKTPAGSEVDWSERSNGVRVYNDDVIVTYKTEPRQADIDDLLPVVFQYATALYDGEDSRTLANILTQCR